MCISLCAIGLAFICSKAAIILQENYNHLPRWFAVVFPAMIELAEKAGLDLVFTKGSKMVLFDLLRERRQILEM